VFQITVKNAHCVPEKEYVHIMGIDAIGNADIGDKITDGYDEYEIISFPFMHRSSANLFEGIDIFINAKSADILIGKTLVAV